MLNDPLKALGMGIAFDENRANFKGMADSTENISISKVKHKTFVDVNKEPKRLRSLRSRWSRPPRFEYRRLSE
jgi:serine protease inhibitor